MLKSPAIVDSTRSIVDSLQFIANPKDSLGKESFGPLERHDFGEGHAPWGQTSFYGFLNMSFNVLFSSTLRVLSRTSDMTRFKPQAASSQFSHCS